VITSTVDNHATLDTQNTAVAIRTLALDQRIYRVQSQHSGGFNSA